jgi:hypothetical protein
MHIACPVEIHVLQDVKIVRLNVKLNLHNEEAKQIEALRLFKTRKV